MKKIWIITAMKEEADLIITKYNLQEDTSFWNIAFFMWEDNWTEIILALCGIWKIQASIWTSLLINKYSPNHYINIWIAGNGEPNTINIWDVLICNSVVQHDIYLPFWWEHLHYAKKSIDLDDFPLMIEDEIEFTIVNNAICATWDQFIDDASKIQELNNAYSSNCVEMEAFSVCSTIREITWSVSNISVIKAISDWADNSAILEHMSNLELAMNNSIIILDKLIEEVT